MERIEFEHLIAAAANVVGEDEFVVIGSQAILGSLQDAPDELLFSMEADVYPRSSPEKAIEIDGALGDGSPFHETYGFYAHGVGPKTAQPPAGWEERLVRLEVPARLGSDRSPVAYCLEPHDLILAKCVAGRERDWAFTRAAIGAGIVQPQTLFERIDTLPIAGQRRLQIKTMIEGIVANS